MLRVINKSGQLDNVDLVVYIHNAVVSAAYKSGLSIEQIMDSPDCQVEIKAVLTDFGLEEIEP